jgi:hypothetical protein
MTAKFAAPGIQSEREEKPTVIERIKTQVRQSLSSMNQYCLDVDSVKTTAERENTKKFGKDWINRCCG